MASVQMGVQEDVAEFVSKVAKSMGIEKSESLDRLVRMGISRHLALAKFAKKGEEKPAKKAAKKTAEKPVKKAAKKAAKQ